MNIYLASLFFEIETEGHTGKAQFDEQWRLVQAVDEAEAWQMAENLGLQLGFSFLNAKNQKVKWHFLAVADLHLIQDLAHGDQVLAFTHEASDKSEFLEKIQLKSKAAATLVKMPVYG
jgi:hypothetical protein